jgi:two-component system sensor histidine kinase SenX3
MSKFQPSVYQQAIYDFITNGQGNAVVSAVAGSGKTTTLINALNLIPSELNVQDLVSEAIDQSQVGADSRKIQILSGEIENGVVLGDRDQIIMAIQNLVENAVNYSPEGTKVTVSSIVKDGIITISITDQGIGIPEVEKDRIFERFYRVDPARSRQSGGTGLGLSIVKHVATKHGGEVSVWSVENVGSTFSLKLPLFSKSEEEI